MVLESIYWLHVDALVPIWCHSICSQACQLVHIKSADGLVPIWCHSICSQASQLVHIKSADGLVPIWSHTICNQASQLVLIKSADGLVPIWSHSICNQASQLVHINSADWRQCCKHISAYEKGISLGPSTNLSSLNKPYWRGINERSSAHVFHFYWQNYSPCHCYIIDSIYHGHIQHNSAHSPTVTVAKLRSNFEFMTNTP